MVVFTEAKILFYVLEVNSTNTIIQDTSAAQHCYGYGCSFTSRNQHVDFSHLEHLQLQIVSDEWFVKNSAWMSWNKKFTN